MLETERKLPLQVKVGQAQVVAKAKYNSVAMGNWKTFTFLLLARKMHWPRTREVLKSHIAQAKRHIHHHTSQLTPLGVFLNTSLNISQLSLFSE